MGTERTVTSDEKVIPERYCSSCHPYGWPNGPMPHEPWCTAAPVIRPSNGNNVVKLANQDELAKSRETLAAVRVPDLPAEIIARAFMRLQCADVPREPWQWEVCQILQTPQVTGNETLQPHQDLALARINHLACKGRFDEADAQLFRDAIVHRPGSVPHHHIWSVNGPPRDPDPEQVCDFGCGLKWKDRQEAEAHAQKAGESRVAYNSNGDAYLAEPPPSSEPEQR